MEWNIKDSITLECAFSSIGSMQGDNYVAGANVLAILEEIHHKLSCEDQILRTFRRSICFNDNIKKDLIPLLINIKDGIIIEAIIRILVNLTIPIECLFTVELMNRTDIGRQTVYELNNLLIKSKECFMDIRTVRAIIDHMKSILEKDFKLPLNQCQNINNCLLLLRNILHIPENTTEYLSHQQHHDNYSSFSISENDHINNNNCNSNGGTSSYHNVNNNNNNNYYYNKNGTIISMQNQILWNLFTLNIDKLLIHLMSCPQKSIWGKTMVQLITVMYKDQHITTLQKLLNVWFVEASLSDSSEDFESNTSPQKVDSGDSSPMLTSDPTSDSSDNGGNNNPNGNSSSDQVMNQQMINLLNRTKEMDIPRNDIGIITKNNNNNRRASSEELKINNQYFNESQFNSLNFDKVDNKMNNNDNNNNNNTSKRDDNKKKHNTNILNSNNKHLKNNNNNNNKNLKSTEDKIDSLNPMGKPTNSNLPSNHNSTENKQQNNNTNYRPSSTNSSIDNNSIPKNDGNDGDEKRELPSSQSELSDCGYGTQLENNQGSISTSSNDDDDDDDDRDHNHDRPIQKVHQKPPSCNQKQRYNAVNHPRTSITIQDKKDLRRKKLVKRNRNTVINMKGLLHHHIPTDEDITNILKEFTVDFLLKGYGYLVQDLHAQLLYESDGNNQIDKSHFFWLITFFLKFATQLELDFEHVRFVLSFDIVSYLTYEGVSLCEQLEMIIDQKDLDLTPYLRRMHLVVTAIREILQAIDTYQKQYSCLSEEDKLQIKSLQCQMSATEDLRCLFILLLRQYNGRVQSKQYLQDLIITNHILLLFLDGTSKFSEYKGKMAKHIEQFATVEIMFHYGLLLEDFKENGEFVNDCIFTMMHHIGGDLGKVSTLFQPIILKTYSQIWETGYELCDDWSDLIEYVIHKFMNTPQQTPLKNLPDFNAILSSNNGQTTISEIWTQDDKNSLYWYYAQSKMSSDVTGKISELFIEYGHKVKPRTAVIEQLLQQDIITALEYDNLMKFENVYYERSNNGLNDHSELIPITIETTCILTTKMIQKPISADDIQNLKENLIKENKGKFLLWLQKLLIECCFVKLTLNQYNLSKKNNNNNNEYLKPLDNIIIFEPIPLHFIIKKQSIPIVPWNTEQQSILTYEPFMLLLHKLGFHLPGDTGKVFIRIPDFWTADILFNVAEKLGTIDKSILKFDIKLLSGHHDGLSDNIIKCSTNLESELFAIPGCKNTNSIIRYTPNPSSPRYARNWLKFVMNDVTGIDSKKPSSSAVIVADHTESSDLIQSTIPIISTISKIIPTITTIPSAIIPIIQKIPISSIILTETTESIRPYKNSSIIPKCIRNISNIFTNHNSNNDDKAPSIIKVNNNNNNKLCKVNVHNCLPKTIVSNQICPSSIIIQSNDIDEIINKTLPSTSPSSSSPSVNQSDFNNNNNNNTINKQEILKNNENNNNDTNQIDYNNCNRRIYNKSITDTDSIEINNKLNGNIIIADDHHHHHRTASIEIIDEENENDIISNYETASVASDLTRMYVSDEDEKPDI